MEYELPKDPIILLGMINMKLRDYYSDMTSLCDDLELDYDSVDTTLDSAGFKYDAKTNQYHPK